jgi:hypothetical protein
MMLDLISTVIREKLLHSKVKMMKRAPLRTFADSYSNSSGVFRVSDRLSSANCSAENCTSRNVISYEMRQLKEQGISAAELMKKMEL